MSLQSWGLIIIIGIPLLVFILGAIFGGDE